MSFSSDQKTSARADAEQSTDEVSASAYDFGYFKHVLPVRVYGEDLGPTMVTGPSSYLRFLDRGRVEAIERLCRDSGRESWLTKFLVNVYRMDVQYLGDSSASEELEVRTGIRRISSHRAAFDQLVVSPATGQVLVDAVVECAFLSGETRELVPVPTILVSHGPPSRVAVGQRVVPIPFSDEDHFKAQQEFRVYYEDTDAQGIVYHVSYVRFCTRALFDIVGDIWRDIPAQQKMDELHLGMGRLEIRFLKSATLGDRVEVRTGTRQLQDRRMILDQRVVDMGSGVVLADVVVTLRFTDDRGRPVDVPPQMVEAYFKPYRRKEKPH